MNITKFIKLCLVLTLSMMIVNFPYGVAGGSIFTKQKISFSYSIKPWYKYHQNGQPGREIMLYFDHDKPKSNLAVSISCEGKKKEYSIVLPSQPIDSLSVLLPANTGIKATKAILTLANGSKRTTEVINVPAKKQWKVYIYPHSHVDIGYTNLQDVVKKLHVRNIDVGIDIAKKTQHYPQGARFVWNPEATWVVDNYLEQASPAQKESFKAAVKKGWVQIDGAHSNINTTTCSDEELLRVFANNPKIATLTGVPITTMVQVDNPGAGWGLVQAAALNGIKGFFSFPNYYDLRNEWENKPFYWLSNDGKSKIFYLQATSYGYGYKAKGSKYGLGKIQAFNQDYDRLSTGNPSANFIDPFIFRETEKLEAQSSPYDIFAMTWSTADNCLIDADLPEAVKLWNEKYAYPKLIISGTREILAAYEERYKAIIPEFKGDMTEFWTQGLGSDANRVGMGRRGKENLIQAETLWSILDANTATTHKKINTVWENLLLSAEHTWGYQDPKAPLAKEVEANKAAFFENAEQQSKQLIAGALSKVKKEGSNSFAVFNTLSWPRNGLVTLLPQQSKAGDKVVNRDGKQVLSQRLSTGELVFLTDTISALSSQLYKILPGKASAVPKMIKAVGSLQNDFLSIVVNEKNGNIKSLFDLKHNREYADTNSFFGMNSYNYMAGVKNGNPAKAPGKISNATSVSVKVKENGPLVASLLITSDAESCNWLTREVRLIRNQPFAELINTVDKISTRKKEGIHYGFAFHIPSGRVRMDIPLGEMTPNEDQIPYANKNWFAFQRWVDISNRDYGITWTAIEAPIIELGSITGNILDGARQASEWLKKVAETQTILSWPINNHWDTNFPLQQGGIITSRYMIQPHNGTYNPVVSNRFGMEQNRPLIAVEAVSNPIEKALVKLDNPKIMISTIKSSEDNKAVILRLKSVSGQREQVKLSWPAGKPKSVFLCLPDELPQRKSNENVTMLPHGVQSLKITF